MNPRRVLEYLWERHKVCVCAKPSSRYIQDIKSSVTDLSVCLVIPDEQVNI